MFIQLLLLDQVKPHTGAKIQTQTNLTIKSIQKKVKKQKVSNVQASVADLSSNKLGADKTAKRDRWGRFFLKKTLTRTTIKHATSKDSE